MKKWSIVFALGFAAAVFAEETVVLSTGEVVRLNDDQTWEYVDHPVNRDDPMTALNHQGISVVVETAKIIETMFDGNKAGLRFKLKNNSEMTVTKLRITVYFLDHDGRRFFEDAYLVVNADSWSDPKVLKPNYSLKYPTDSSRYATADGLDLDEWDEGKIVFEVTEIVVAEDSD